MKKLLKILETASTNGLTLFIKYFLIAIFITITYLYKSQSKIGRFEVPHLKTKEEVFVKVIFKTIHLIFVNTKIFFGRLRLCF